MAIKIIALMLFSLLLISPTTFASTFTKSKDIQTVAISQTGTDNDIDETVNVTVDYSPLGQTSSSGSMPVTIANDQTSLLQKLRVAEPQTLFSSYHIYDKMPLIWDELTATGGTSTLTTATASIALATTTSSGSRVVRQSREYMYYEPGKSIQILATGVMGAGKTNAVQRIGYFDDNNGLFFELNGTTLNVVTRSNTSGSIVDTAVPQSSWNIDKLDGTGDSGVTLDITKAQLFVIEYLWLGVGRVRYGFYENGTIVYVHTIDHSNISSGVYMATASLPVRYENVNTGATASATTLTQICAAINSETAYVPLGVKQSANTGATARAIGAGAAQPAALITIRLKSAYNRATIIPKSFSIISTTADNLWYRIVLNATIGGTPVYNSVNSTSIAEFDIAGTTITGGTVIASGYTSSVDRNHFEDLSSRIRLVSSLSGTPDTLSVVVGSVGAGAFSASASMDWQEYE